MKKEKWLSCYLYYSSDWDKFLVEAVGPFAEMALKENLAKGYFFIRYWERGPHIRLRFKGDEEILKNKLKPKLEKHFEAYFRRYPSAINDSTLLRSVPEGQECFPNNSIQFIEYIPEVERYGGKTGILISEKLFEASSNTCLNILSEGDYNDYDKTSERVLSVAIPLHLALCCSFDFTKETLPAVFDLIINNWLPMTISNVFGINIGKLKQYEAEEYKNAALKIFKNEFERLHQSIVPFVKQIHEGLMKQSEFENEWLNIWLRDTKGVYTDLKMAINMNKIEIPDWHRKLMLNYDLTSDRSILLYLLPSYIHMTNNRIGVSNHNEAFITYLLKKSMECV